MQAAMPPLELMPPLAWAPPLDLAPPFDCDPPLALAPPAASAPPNPGFPPTAAVPPLAPIMPPLALPPALGTPPALPAAPPSPRPPFPSAPETAAEPATLARPPAVVPPTDVAAPPLARPGSGVVGLSLPHAKTPSIGAAATTARRTWRRTSTTGEALNLFTLKLVDSGPGHGSRRATLTGTATSPSDHKRASLMCVRTFARNEWLSPSRPRVLESSTDTSTWRVSDVRRVTCGGRAQRRQLVTISVT